MLAHLPDKTCPHFRCSAAATSVTCHRCQPLAESAILFDFLNASSWRRPPPPPSSRSPPTSLPAGYQPPRHARRSRLRQPPENAPPRNAGVSDAVATMPGSRSTRILFVVARPHADERPLKKTRRPRHLLRRQYSHMLLYLRTQIHIRRICEYYHGRVQPGHSYYPSLP